MADQEVIKAMKREIAYRSFMVFVAATVLITVCVAWFANNQQVQASEMTIQPSVDGFELAAQGDSIGVFDQLHGSEGYETPSSSDFITYNGNTITGYKTSGDNASISWAVSDTSNMENVVDNSDVRLVPGSSGAMTFYIIPNGDGALSLKLKLSLQGLTEQESGETKTYVEADKDPQNLLEHHLLLFAGKKGDTYNHWISPDAGSWEGLELLESAEGTPSATLSYSYSDDTLTWTGEDLKKDVAYPVTIYWIWPEVLGQYIFADARNNQPALFPDLPSGLFAKMAQADNGNNCNDYMMWNDSIESFKNEVNNGLLESLRNGTGNMAMYQKISVYYNRADQCIGENIRYVRLTLDAN